MVGGSELEGVLSIMRTSREGGEKRMSTKDLISKWEDALAQVLTSHVEPENAEDDIAEEDLRSALAACRLKSALRAGDWWPTPTGMC